MMPEDPIQTYIIRSDAQETTKRSYSDYLGKAQKIIGKPLLEATEEDLLRLKAEWSKHKAGYRWAAILRSFYTQFGRTDLARVLKGLKPPRKRLDPDEILTPEEVEAIIMASREIASSPEEGTRNVAFVSLLYECGVRVGEICNLRARDIKHVQNPLPGMSRHDGYQIWFGKVKVKGEEHLSFLIERKAALDAWLEIRKGLRLKSEDPLLPWLFRDDSWGRMGRRSALDIVKRSAQKAGVTKRVWLHLFRHTRYTHLITGKAFNGRRMDRFLAKKLVGWAPGSPIPDRVYGHMDMGPVLEELGRLQSGAEAPPQDAREGPPQGQGGEIWVPESQYLIFPEVLKQALVEALRDPGVVQALREALLAEEVRR